MSKLQKYNKVIQSVAATFIVIGVLFFGGLTLYYEFGGGVSHEITSEEQLAADRKAGIRRQKATFTPHTLGNERDENWSWALISVGVKTLENPEGLSKPLVPSRGRSYRHNDAINLILWNKNTTENRLVFIDRVDIEATHYFGDDELEYILIVARPTDSSLSNLYHYSIAQNELEMIKIEDYLLTGFAGTAQINGEEVSLVSLANDQNDDGRYDNKQEITIPWRFDPETKSLKPLASPEIYDRAQSILDGD